MYNVLENREHKTTSSWEKWKTHFMFTRFITIEDENEVEEKEGYYVFESYLICMCMQH